VFIEFFDTPGSIIGSMDINQLTAFDRIVARRRGAGALHSRARRADRVVGGYINFVNP